MPQCDICGREAQLVDAVIEGSVLSVCKDCARHGTIIKAHSTEPKVAKEKPKETIKGEELFVSDCAEKVKRARERMGITQEQLAKAIAEKKSLIHRIETGQAEPTLATALKLERFLGIKIIESYIPKE